MSDSLSIAASGLEAANAMMAAAANNLANLNTSGYVPRQVHLSEVAKGRGVAVVDIVAIAAPAESASAAHSGSGVDPVAEAINFRKAESLYTANAAVIAASRQMFGNMLNMLDTEQNAPPEMDSDNVL